MKKLYLLLAIIGFVLPYYFLVSFLVENGPNLSLFFSQLIANDISTFFAVDLVITAIVFWVFLYQESQRHQIENWWIYLVATLLVGPSFAVPLFLSRRESQLERFSDIP